MASYINKNLHKNNMAALLCHTVNSNSLKLIRAVLRSFKQIIKPNASIPVDSSMNNARLN
jgi:hypothetical protein